MQTNCLNCGHITEEKFCPECGQKTHTSKITFKSLAHDVPHSVFHLDKGFLYTFTQLLKRPGHAVKDFIEGKRVSHYSPFAYLFILTAASSFTDHIKANYFIHVKHRQIEMNSGILFPDAARFFDAYPAMIFCCMIPLMSFWSWLFNIKKPYNYWENLVLNTYLIAQFNLFIIIQAIVTMVNGRAGIRMTPMLVAFFCYFAYSYIQFFGADKGFLPALSRFCLMFMAVLTLITVLSLCGYMTPWW